MSKNRKLSEMFTIALVIMTIIPICLASFFVFRVNLNNSMRDFNNGVNNSLVMGSNFLDNFDSNNRRTVNLFCSYPAVQNINGNLNRSEILDTIDKFQKNCSESKIIGVGLPNGQTLVQNNIKLSANFDPRKRIWYEKAIENPGQTILTNSYESAVQNEVTTITYSKAIIDNKKRVAGVVGLDINFDVLKDGISRVKLGNSGFFMFFDADGNLIQSNDNNKYKSISQNNNYWIDKVNYGSSKPAKILISGKYYMCYGLKNKTTNWSIVAIVPEDEYNYNNAKIATTIVIVAIVLILICIIVGNIISKIFINPSQEILDTLNKAGGGDYTVRIDFNKRMPRELQNIVESINNTIGKVEEQTSDLASQNEEIAAQNDEISCLYQQTTAMNSELNELLDQIKEEYKETVMALANAIEAKDEYTKGHCERVTYYAVKIAEKMNLKSTDIEKIEIAGLIHDIGKIGIPMEVLNKNGKLTNEEYEIIKKHPTIGYNIIKDLKFLKDSGQILFQHHERIDGKGYPQGLSGNEIDDYAAIISVADSYDAMTSSRPYRRVPLTKEEAINQLVINKGTQFKPEIVDIFIEILNEDPS